MTTDAENRFTLFEFLRDRWGSDQAGRLMDLLPPAGAAALATKQDLAALETRLRGEIADVRVELRTEIADVRLAVVDLKAELLDKMRVDFRTIMVTLVTLWLTNLVAVVGAVAALR